MLSLGTSVLDYLKNSEFDSPNNNHKNIAAIVGSITTNGRNFTDAQIADLDKFTVAIMSM
jgi:hypothetical protein